MVPDLSQNKFLPISDWTYTGYPEEPHTTLFLHSRKIVLTCARTFTSCILSDTIAQLILISIP